MTIRTDKIAYTVTLGGADVTSYVALPLSVSYGFDMRIGEASVKFRTLPAGLTNWATMSISMGRVGVTGNIQRFDGYVFDPAWELWPYSMTVPCKSPLILADIGRVPRDDYDDAYMIGGSGLPATALYLAQGIDMSRVPVDDTHGLTVDDYWQDSNMVMYVLDKCGLASKYSAGDILGIGKYLGISVTNPLRQDLFTWRRGQSGLEFLEDLEKICQGHRTFDTITGIKRKQLDPTQWFMSGIPTIAEATDILEGSSLTQQASEGANRVVVTGADYGRSPMVVVMTEGWNNHGETGMGPPAGGYVTRELSSPMIELDEPDTVTNQGLSCREVASWLINETNRRFYDASIVTWRDDLFQPGDFYYVNAPHLGPTDSLAFAGYGVMQGMWLRRVDTIIGEDGSFTQRLNFRNSHYTGVAGPSMPFSLSMGMGLYP